MLQLFNNIKKEKEDLMKSLKARAETVTKVLNSMKNIKSNEVEGAMYAFPSVFLPKKAIEEAKSKNMAPDLFYTMEVLDKTGICLVPGSGFKQKEGTYHFRITTLVLPQEKLLNKMNDFKKFNDEFMSKYE